MSSLRRLFISYARENKSDVDQLVEHLAMMGYETWVDFKLRGGQEWWAEILRRISDADVFVVVLSNASLKSTACRREFDWAEALDRPILPVAVEALPAALPRRFAERHIVDYSQRELRDRSALMLQGGLATITDAPPLPEPLPTPPGAPLNYLTDLIDLIDGAAPIDHAHQHQIVQQLGVALRSVDPEERRGGRDILERFASRADLYADVDRMISGLRESPDEPLNDDDVSSDQAVVADSANSTVGHVETDQVETQGDQAITPSGVPTKTSSDGPTEDASEPQPRRMATRTKLILVALTVVLIVVSVSVAIAVLRKPSSTSSPPPDPEGPRLMALVPSNFSSCKSEPMVKDEAPGAIASVECQPEAGAPVYVIHFFLFPDRATMDSYFTVSPDPCANGVQGLQPWSHTGTTEITGRVKCSVNSIQQWRVEWTYDSQLVVGLAAGWQGKPLQDVYVWWVNHAL